MQICVRPNIPDTLELADFPIVLNDEYGHHIKNVTKITFKLLSEKVCFVVIEYPEKDPKTNFIIEKSRMFVFKGCKIDLTSIGLTEKREKFHASLEPTCKSKIPLYVKVAMKVVDRFLKKQESVVNAGMV